MDPGIFFESPTPNQTLDYVDDEANDHRVWFALMGQWALREGGESRIFGELGKVRSRV